jgi:hypothetical protein
LRSSPTNWSSSFRTRKASPGPPRHSISEQDRPEFRADILADSRTRKRPAKRTKLVWYKIIGDKVVDTRDVPGKYIPIIRAVGQETIIDGKLDRKGMVRPLKDTQRNLNFWVSSGAEALSPADQVPWVGPAAAFENHPEWANANTKNYAYLSYNHKDDQDVPIPAPTRPNAAAVCAGLRRPASRSPTSSSRTSPASTKTRKARKTTPSGRAISPARKAATPRPITSRMRWRRR